MIIEEKTIEGLLLKERWELIQKAINGNQIKIRHNNLYINDKLHARVLNAKLHTLSSAKHHSTTTDTLQSTSHGESVIYEPTLDNQSNQQNDE